MTRHNNSDLDVDNRDAWTVDRVHRDGSVTVSEGGRVRTLPRDYIEAHTHLAYASTEYGVQGATVDYAHGIVTDSSTAQAVYVAATRGRHHNAGDRGVDAARAGVHRDLDGITLAPHPAARDTSARATSVIDQLKAEAARKAALSPSGVTATARSASSGTADLEQVQDRTRDDDLGR